MSNLFEPLYQALMGDIRWTPAGVREMRAESYARFAQCGWPTRQNEDWKYTSTRSLAATPFGAPHGSAPDTAALALHSLADADRLVFVNGAFNPGLSTVPENMVALPLHEALLNHWHHIRPCMTSADDSLSLLNQAFFSGGTFLTVKKATASTKPLQLLYLQNAASQPAMISPRNIIFVEAGAFVSFLETHVGDTTHFTNAVTDVFVKEQAQCQYLLERILGSDTQYVSKHNFHVSRDARIETFNLALGGKLNRSHLEFRLTAPGSYAKLDGLYMSRAGNHIDNVTEVLHLAAHSSSSQVYKGILEGQSRAVFNGKITIVKDAQHVVAHQLNKNLLMSKEAEVDSRPQLTIDANDVKCSHGATIGQIDEQELFYLQSRAIPRAEAQQMLSAAFVGDVLSRIAGTHYTKHVHNVLQRFGGTTH